MALHHGNLTDAIIGAFYDVYNSLGHGFLEQVYEKALAHELRKRGYNIAQQAPLAVYYDDITIGTFYADLLVNELIVVEIKTAITISAAHKAQLVHYLKALHLEVGLVLNFGPSAQFSRQICTSHDKYNPEKLKQKNPRQSA
jgi:GxxExxY protein